VVETTASSAKVALHAVSGASDHSETRPRPWDRAWPASSWASAV
jgi:hypothetical protein